MPVEGTLELRLGYFLLRKVLDVVDDIDQATPISISYYQLSKWLDEAEEEQQGFMTGDREDFPAGAEFYKRSETPDPPLSEEREARFLELEAKDEKRIEDEDSDS